MRNGSHVRHKPTGRLARISDRFFDPSRMYVSVTWDKRPTDAPFGRMPTGGNSGHVAVYDLEELGTEDGGGN